MTQPRSDGIDVHARAKQMDRRGVPNDMGTDALDSTMTAWTSMPILRNEPPACVCRSESCVRFFDQGIPGRFHLRPVTNRDNAVTVAGHSGHRRHLFPLPMMRTAGDPFSCRLPMSNPAASSARAPLLYRNNRMA